MNSRWLVAVAAAVLFGCSGSSGGGSTGGTSSGTNAGSGSSGSTASTGSGSGSGSGSSCPAIASTGGTGAGICQNANGSACSSLPFSGCPVHELQVAQPAPTAAGGTPVAGTYSLTAVTDYLGTGATPAETGNYRQGALVFSGSSVEIHEQNIQVGGPTCEDSQTGTVTFNGSNVTLTPNCPATGNNGGTASYSATANTFVLFDPPDGNRTFVRGNTYTKQ